MDVLNDEISMAKEIPGKIASAFNSSNVNGHVACDKLQSNPIAKANAANEITDAVPWDVLPVSIYSCVLIATAFSTQRLCR